MTDKKQNQKPTLIDRLRELLQNLDNVLNPPAPAPQPVPVRKHPTQ
ncbi:MAG: hypothetical protein L0154_25495 [Chloroflexi bacterium]|nr:hypothetical protein [Chloroflexota bacterium]